MITDDTAESTTQSRSVISRTLAVIDAIARAPHDRGVSVIARETGLPKTVTHRILRELVTENFLAFDETTKAYRMGPGARNIGLAAMRELDVPSIAHRHLVALAEQTGQTTTLSLRQGWSRVYVDQVLSRQEIRMSVALGTSHPLHAGSSSKAILAALPDNEVEDYIVHHRLDGVTDATITSATTLRDEIHAIRKAGYAVSVGERQVEAASVASCVYGPIGQVVGSVSICGTKSMFGETSRGRLGEHVAHAAARISADLGAVRETNGERKDTQ